MSSTTNAVDIQMSILQKSTAATTVSRYEYSKKSGSQTGTGFDGFLNKASNSISIGKTNADRNNRALDTSKNNQKTDTNKIQNTDNKDKTTQKQSGEKTKKTTETKTKIKDDVKTKDVNKTSRETDSRDADTKLQDAIEKDGREIAAEIAKALEIDVEDVTNAMELLGLMFVDILEPVNIQNIVTQLGGQDKALDLITDPDLNTMMQDLYEGAESMKSELMNEFDLSEEDLKTIVSESKKDFVSQFKEELVATVKEELPVKEKDPQSKELATKIEVEVISEEETVSEFKPVEGTSDTSKQNSKNTGENLSDNNQNTNLFNQLLNNITEAAQAKSAESPHYVNREQMENIVRQITDKITITAAQHETSMELQLHPASLGNVNVLLTSSKDGIVAKFTAQNEIVKEAIENQMQVLQQKFNEQGIKVTSIEITIASHAFEQNLQQDDQNKGFEEQQSKKKNLRRINLGDDLSPEDADNLSEEEKLAASVMAMNGNSVDFSA